MRGPESSYQIFRFANAARARAAAPTPIKALSPLSPLLPNLPRLPDPGSAFAAWDDKELVDAGLPDLQPALPR